MTLFFFQSNKSVRETIKQLTKAVVGGYERNPEISECKWSGGGRLKSKACSRSFTQIFIKEVRPCKGNKIVLIKELI